MMMLLILPLLFALFSLNACDISDLPKEQVLIALYDNACNPRVGMNRLNETTGAELAELDHILEGTTGLSIDDARMLLRKKNPMIDYVKGVGIKMNLSGDTCKTDSFNSLHGEGKAEKIISALRKQLNKDKSK